MISLAAMGAGLAHGWLADLSLAATGSLVAAVWQGFLLAGAAALGLRLLPKTPAAVRFAIWFGVFLVVAALPVLSLWPHAAGAAGGRGPWITLDERWCLAIAVVWAMASLVRAGTLVVAAFRVRALWKRATPVEIRVPQGLKPVTQVGLRGTAEAVPLSKTNATEGPSTVHAADGACLAQDDDSGTVRRARICTSDEVDRPTVIGFFSPKIVIPEWLLERLTPAELEQIVLHESGHLGRADDWMNLLQKIALVVFPLNPALAWVERRLCFERELAVDERVLQATGAPKAYAACLATLAEHRLQRRRGLTLVLGALGRESELGRRVGWILRRETHMKPLHAKLVLGGAVLGLLVSTSALERCPQVVGFSTANKVEAGNREQGFGKSELPGFAARPVSLRMHVAGAQEWKLTAAADAKRPPLNNAIQRNVEAEVRGQSDAVRAIDVARKTPKNPAEPGLRMVQTAASSQPSLGEDVVITQWTVVTPGQDGSRTVLTTAQIGKSAPRVEQDTDAPQPQQQEVPRYAAVPVQGGWLIFRL